MSAKTEYFSSIQFDQGRANFPAYASPFVLNGFGGHEWAKMNETFDSILASSIRANLWERSEFDAFGIYLRCASIVFIRVLIRALMRAD